MRVAGHRALNGRAARLALALPVVPVADREHRPLDVDAEEDGRAGPHLRSVHVAAEPVGYQGRTHLSSGGSDANGAEHRLDRELYPVVAVPCREPDCPAVAVELVDPGGVGKRFLQGDDTVGARHAAEEGDSRRGAPVPCRFQIDEVQHERVAGFRALDVERAGLRVDETQVDFGARQVIDTAQHSVERVLRPEPERGSGPDPHGSGDSAEGVGVLVAGGRVLDDVHVRNYCGARAQPHVVGAKIGHPRRRRGARASTRPRGPRCRPRAPLHARRRPSARRGRPVRPGQPSPRERPRRPRRCPT